MPTKEPKSRADSLDAWVQKATHYPLLPSGARVGIKIPDLPAMIEAGEVPQHLLDVALDVASGVAETKPSIELIKSQREFTDLIVQKTVVEPQLDENTVKNVPFEDKEMLVSFSTRQRDLDAEGEHLAGLTTSEKFRRFRGLAEFESNVEGL